MFLVILLVSICLNISSFKILEYYVGKLFLSVHLIKIWNKSQMRAIHYYYDYRVWYLLIESLRLFVAITITLRWHSRMWCCIIIPTTFSIHTESAAEHTRSTEHRALAIIMRGRSSTDSGAGNILQETLWRFMLRVELK